MNWRRLVSSMGSPFGPPDQLCQLTARSGCRGTRQLARGRQRRSARAGARAHDGEFAQCIASAGRDRDGRFAEVHLGKIPHQRLVERLIKTGSNDLRFEQRANPIEPFEQFAQISGQIRYAKPLLPQAHAAAEAMESPWGRPESF